ncbi:MAG: hypothetical protein AAF226_00935 [Verrucomicrobiota bacterium]
MPHLVKMDERYKEKGLLLVAPEVQGTPKADLLQFVENNDITYTVTSRITGPIKVSGLPHRAIFDVNGKIIYNGYPNEDSDDIIKDALRDVEEEPSTSIPRRIELVPEREWTDAATGRKLTASILTKKGNVIRFKFPDGRTFDYDVTKLSQEDQDMITAAEAGETEE